MKRYLISIAIPLLLTMAAIGLEPYGSVISIADGLRAFAAGCLFGIALNIAYERGRKDGL